MDLIKFVLLLIVSAISSTILLHPADIHYVYCESVNLCFYYDTYQYEMLPKDTKEEDMCKEKCNGTIEHSYCLKDAGKECENFQQLPMDAEHVKNIVHQHNMYRQRIAYNQRRPAGNMNILEWDSKLAKMAAGWIKQCKKALDRCDFICKCYPS